MTALQDLFDRSDNQRLDFINESVNIFKPPPQITASIVILSKSIEKQDDDQSKQITIGRKGAAIVPNEFNTDIYNIICYETQNRELTFSIPINPISSLSKYEFIFNIIDETTISFPDHMQSSIQWILKFPNNSVFQLFITHLSMVKVPSIWTQGILSQDLNFIPNDPEINELSEDIDVNDPDKYLSIKLKTKLKIWLFSDNHPWDKGKLVFCSDKVLNLLSYKVIKALKKGLKGVKDGVTRLIIAGSDLCFGFKGNKTLSIPSDAPLIFEVTVNEICIQQIPKDVEPEPIMPYKVNIPAVAPWNEEKVDEVQENDKEHGQKEGNMTIKEMELEMKERFAIYDARLDSLSVGIERNNKLMMDIQTNMSRMFQQINDLRLIMVDEKKNDEIEIMKKEIEDMKKMMLNGDGRNKIRNKVEFGKDEIDKVREWMIYEVGLGEYVELFIQNGFDTMEVIKSLKMEDLEVLGIEKLGHKRRIIQSVLLLKEHETEGVLCNE